jgi:hypothetical protein
VTAETITDAQIRELARTAVDLDTRALCSRALRIPLMFVFPEARKSARSRCAELLNVDGDVAGARQT